MFQGAYFQFENYTAFENACRIRSRLVRETEALFKNVDFLVLPIRRLGFPAATAATINEVYDAFSMALPANVTGQPSISVPGLALGAETDLGLQLIGPSLSDARLLSIASRMFSLAPLPKGGK